MNPGRIPLAPAADLAGYCSDEAILDHLKARLSLRQRAVPNKAIETDNEMGVNLILEPTGSRSEKQGLMCEGTFTVQNEEVIDLSDGTLAALGYLFFGTEDWCQAAGGPGTQH